MNFEKTKDGIGVIEHSGKVSTTDIFRLFHNICDDAESILLTKLEDTPCKDVEEKDLVVALTWASKKMLRVISANKAHIGSPILLKKLNGEIDKLSQTIEEMEKENQQIHLKTQEQLKKLEEEKQLGLKNLKDKTENEKRVKDKAIQNQQELLEAETAAARELKEREDELLATKAKLDDKTREKESLVTSCSQLQTRISGFQNVNIPKLTNEKEQLELLENSLKGQITVLKNEVKQIGTRITGLKNEQENLKADKILKNEELTKEQIVRDGLLEAIENVKTQIEDVKHDIKNKNADLALANADLGTLDIKQQELIRRIQKIREDMSAFSIDILQQRLKTSQEEYERKKREFEDEEKKVNVVQSGYRKEYENWEEQLETKKQSLKQEYTEKKATVEDEEKKAENTHKVLLSILEEQKRQNEAKIKKQNDEIQQQKKDAEIEYQSKLASIALEEKAKVEAIEKQKQGVLNRIQEKEDKIQAEQDKRKKLENDFVEISEKLKQEIQTTKDVEREYKDKVSELKKQQKDLEISLNEAKKELKILQDWFSSKVALTKQSDLTSLEGQIKVLEQVKEEVLNEFRGQYFMDCESVEKNMNQYLESELSKIETELEQFSKKYAMLTMMI